MFKTTFKIINDNLVTHYCVAPATITFDYSDFILDEFIYKIECSFDDNTPSKTIYYNKHVSNNALVIDETIDQTFTHTFNDSGLYTITTKAYTLSRAEPYKHLTFVFAEEPILSNLEIVRSYSSGLDKNIFLVLEGTVNSVSRFSQPSSTFYTSIGAGSGHSVAIDMYGNVWSWGDNSSGEIGYPIPTLTSNKFKSPVNISEYLENSLYKKDIAKCFVNGTRSFFLDSDDKMWACGSNAFGELGLNSSSTKVFTPEQIDVGEDIVSIAQGGSSLFVVTSTGKVFASGKNLYGQLGIGTYIDTSTLTPVIFPSGTSIVAAAAGFYHSLFIDSIGRVWVCGDHSKGQLGLGAISPSVPDKRNIPVILTSLSSSSITSIAAGEYHSVFLSSSGVVRSCGNNQYGQLGNNLSVSTDYYTPVTITSLSTEIITKISSSYRSTLALSNKKEVWTTGWNIYGQQGNDTIINNNVFKKIADLVEVNNISAGWYHNLFATSNGYLWAVGRNNTHQLGDGSTADRRVVSRVLDIPSSYGSHLKRYVLPAKGLWPKSVYAISTELNEFLTTEADRAIITDYMPDLPKDERDIIGCGTLTESRYGKFIYIYPFEEFYYGSLTLTCTSTDAPANFTVSYNGKELYKTGFLGNDSYNDRLIFDRGLAATGLTTAIITLPITSTSNSSVVPILDTKENNELGVIIEVDAPYPGTLFSIDINCDRLVTVPVTTPPIIESSSTYEINYIAGGASSGVSTTRNITMTAAGKIKLTELSYTHDVTDMYWTFSGSAFTGTGVVNKFPILTTSSPYASSSIELNIIGSGTYTYTAHFVNRLGTSTKTWNITI